MLYGSLIWPTFVETNGMVFLAEEKRAQPALDDPSRTLADMFHGDQAEMERQFNYVAVSTLVGARPGVDDDDAEDRLARLLEESWAAKLAREYPNWDFAVEVTQEDDGPWIRFFATSRPLDR